MASPSRPTVLAALLAALVFYSKGRGATLEIDVEPAYTHCEAEGQPQ